MAAVSIFYHNFVLSFNLRLLMHLTDSSPSLPLPAGAATPLVVEAQQVPSALLARLLQEVQHEAQPNLTAYNRTHNRHNRGR